MCLSFTSYCQDDKIHFEIRITRVEGCKSGQLQMIDKTSQTQLVHVLFIYKV
jgi:hypothetical protein